jgi:hypothetical protein
VIVRSEVDRKGVAMACLNFYRLMKNYSKLNFDRYYFGQCGLANVWTLPAVELSCLVFCLVPYEIQVSILSCP